MHPLAPRGARHKHPISKVGAGGGNQTGNGGLNKTSHGNVKMHGFENLCHVSAVHSTG